MEQEIKEEMNPGKKERGFTGVWIRKEIYLATGLNWYEKVLYVEIESLTKKKGCFASNKYFANFLNIGESTISKAINKLISLGLVELESFDGRKRTLRIASDISEKLKGCLMNSIKQPNEINEYINKSLLDRDYSSKTKVLEVQASPELPSSFDKSFHNKPSLLKRSKAKRIRSKLKDNHSLIPKKKETKPITVPATIQDIIDYWNNSGLRQHKNPSTNVYKDIVKRAKQLIRGRFEVNEYKDKKITSEQIKLAIGHFKIATTNPSYEPQNKTYLKGLSLVDFIYNPRSIGNKALLLFYLNPPLPLKDPPVTDIHPELTKEFKAQYVQKVLGNSHSNGFTSREENCFRKAGKMLTDFFKKNGDKILLEPLERQYPVHLVRYVFAALDKQLNEDLSRVTPGWFSQESLYWKTLPAYLYQQAMIEEPLND